MRRGGHRHRAAGRERLFDRPAPAFGQQRRDRLRDRARRSGRPGAWAARRRRRLFRETGSCRGACGLDRSHLPPHQGGRSERRPGAAASSARGTARHGALGSQGGRLDPVRPGRPGAAPHDVGARHRHQPVQAAQQARRPHAARRGARRGRPRELRPAARGRDRQPVAPKGDAIVSRLRRKATAAGISLPLHAVRGTGYRFQA